MRLFFISLSIFLLIDWVLSSPPALSSISCQIKSKNSLSEVLEMCQGVDIFKAERYEFNGLSKADFNRLFWNVKKIEGWIEFTNTKIAIMNFPRLEETWETNITISRNIKLIEVLFPVLVHAHFSANGGLIFEHNSKLEKLEFPQTRHLSWGPHRYENNSALKSIKFTGLRTCYFRSLLVLRNPLLEFIEFTQEYEFIEIKVGNLMRIEDNESLKEIIFRQKRGQKAKWGMWTEMRIVNNTNLVTIPGQFQNGNITMKIRGNPQLSGKVLAELRAAANKNSSEIQEIGEPVRNLALLEICAYVYGQLELTASVEGSTSVRLNRVEGDVFTSDAPIERLQFLLNTDIYGKFESSLCDFDFSGFRAGKKGTRRGCQTTTTEEWTTIGEGESSTRTTGITTTDKTTTAALETDETTRTTEGNPTTETKSTEAASVSQETTGTTITSTEMSRETPRMIEETTEGITTTERETSPAGIRMTTASQGIILTSLATTRGGSFPYRPVILVSAALLVFFILLGIVLWIKKKKIKEEKALKQELSSPLSQISTSTTTSR